MLVLLSLLLLLLLVLLLLVLLLLPSCSQCSCCCSPSSRDRRRLQRTFKTRKITLAWLGSRACFRSGLTKWLRCVPGLLTSANQAKSENPFKRSHGQHRRQLWLYCHTTPHSVS